MKSELPTLSLSLNKSFCPGLSNFEEKIVVGPSTFAFVPIKFLPPRLRIKNWTCKAYRKKC